MALSKNARGKLQKLVQQSKRLLYKDISDQLRQFYGIFPETGKILLVAELPTNDAGHFHTAKLLRQRLTYIKSNLADSADNGNESIEQLIREQAFTVLNRLAALRMAEERNFIRESIRKDYSSEGFQVYDSITGQGQTAEIFTRYNWYLHSVFDELALDLPAVFDRFSPYAILFPGEQALMEVLSLINNHDISNHREEGQPVINLWRDDETIGWIYQYYNSREEIKAMRDASDAPRNSRELAVRNQFFTPRYVVQFLTDNSLGRIWYEMTKGNTELKTYCQYLIVRPGEVFLEKGVIKPAEDQDGSVYIDHRPIKDPREIRMLDPACGSMHFGLYSFDLFEIIYLEAWDKYPDLLTDLKNTITRSNFIKQIPELIIRHNIHGVDIDPRALQIAALSLWLRAQRSFDKLNLQPADRPQITKSNLVLAEPMPGDSNLLHQVLEPLDKPMQELVLHIWELMKMAGETGLLLRIEIEIDLKIQSIANSLKEESKKAQLQIGDGLAKQKVAEDAVRYASKQYREEFLDNAESQVLYILKHLAHEAHNGNAYQKLLFADDSARGFSFIELCRKRYDVVLMNPPFGLGLRKNFEWMQKQYPDAYVDLLATFIQRGFELSNSHLGAITSRSILITPKLERIRKNTLIDSITCILDLGSPVMDDAMVQSAAYILSKINTSNNLIAFDRKKYSEKDFQLCISIADKIKDENKYIVDKATFYKTPNYKILYNLPVDVLTIIQKNQKLKDHKIHAKGGMRSFDDNRFVRIRHEVAQKDIGSKWFSYAKGGEYSIFYTDLPVMIYYFNDGIEIQEINRKLNGTTAQARQSSSFYFRSGCNFSHRCKDFAVRILPNDYVLGTKGPIVLSEDSELSNLLLIGLLNSSFYNFLVNIQANANQYDTGIIESLPYLNINEANKKLIENSVSKAINTLRNYDSFKEESALFHSLPKCDSLKEIIHNFSIHRNTAILDVESALVTIDDIVDSTLNIKSSDLLSKISEFNDEGEIHISTHSEKASNFISSYSSIEITKRIVSYVNGVIIGRWVVPINENELRDFTKDNIFDNFNANVPARSDQNSKDISFVINETSIDLSFEKRFEEIVFRVFNSKKLSYEILEQLKYESYSAYFKSTNGFFDHHLNLYTTSRRTAPIYWPLSSSSGSYTIWLYYPKLNDQTIYRVVLDFIKPKEEDLIGNIRNLQNNPDLDNQGLKELQVKLDLLNELQEFSNELLQIANLPYKPNQNDGVLITAAPLYKFFRHTKWRKSTAECWNSLENGEFDWSHLAYSIWPERVHEKCLKDLSLAIAHGLEAICEVKPKEEKEKANKAPKTITKNPQLNLEA